MPIPASEQSLAASIAAHESWANTPNRSARTAPARRALDQKFLEQAGVTPIVPRTCAVPTSSVWR